MKKKNFLWSILSSSHTIIFYFIASSPLFQRQLNDERHSDKKSGTWKVSTSGKLILQSWFSVNRKLNFFKGKLNEIFKCFPAQMLTAQQTEWKLIATLLKFSFRNKVFHFGTDQCRWNGKRSEVLIIKLNLFLNSLMSPEGRLCTNWAITWIYLWIFLTAMGPRRWEHSL